MSTRYYRTVIRFEILSDEPLPDCLTLGDIEEWTQSGPASGRFLDEEISEEVSAERMRELLIEQGSDPEFLVAPDEETEDENP